MVHYNHPKIILHVCFNKKLIDVNKISIKEIIPRIPYYLAGIFRFKSLVCLHLLVICLK
jgi:hypothetical protein